MTVSKSSSLIFHSTVSRSTPALVTRMSRRPKLSTAVATSFCAVSVGPTGATTATALPPSASIEATACCGRVGIHVVDDDGCALPGELGGVGETEAPPGSGDDGDLACKRRGGK